MAAAIWRAGPDPAAALAQYRGRAPVYDSELVPFEPFRADAIRLLRLQPGATVVDVGCGTGLSFEPLRKAVGPHGRIVGIEPCLEMIGRAAERVQRHRWRNVDLVQATAARAAVQAPPADALLFHFTHDVLRDEASLANMLRLARPGARVVATGLQWAPPWMWATNAFVLGAALYSVTALEGLSRPWDRLAARLDDVEVQTPLMGGIFIAAGRYRGAPD